MPVHSTHGLVVEVELSCHFSGLVFECLEDLDRPVVSVLGCGQDQACFICEYALDVVALLLGAGTCGP